jgi:hypothetical protein
MTFTFQALEFYAKHGFEVIAVVNEHPRGHKNVLMRKRLTPVSVSLRVAAAGLLTASTAEKAR